MGRRNTRDARFRTRIGLLLRLGLFQRDQLGFGQHQALLGAIGFESFEPFLHGSKSWVARDGDDRLSGTPHQPGPFAHHSAKGWGPEGDDRVSMGTGSIMIGYRSRGRPSRRGERSRSDKGRFRSGGLATMPARIGSTKLPRRRCLHLTAEAAVMTAVSRIASAQAYPTRAPAPPGTTGIPRPGEAEAHITARVRPRSIAIGETPCILG
jgi:hypothetical protein